jgi:hypothetical protein
MSLSCDVYAYANFGQYDVGCIYMSRTVFHIYHMYHDCQNCPCRHHYEKYVRIVRTVRIQFAHDPRPVYCHNCIFIEASSRTRRDGLRRRTGRPSEFTARSPAYKRRTPQSEYANLCAPSHACIYMYTYEHLNVCTVNSIVTCRPRSRQLG